MLHNVTSTSRKALRSKLAPSPEERKELGITSHMTLKIYDNLHKVIDRHNAEWLAENC
jgi:hypothetical protein